MNRNSCNKGFGFRVRNWHAASRLVVVFLLLGASFVKSQTTWTPLNLNGAAGSISVHSGTVSITGSGTGAGATGDQMFYGYEGVAGDFQFTARILSVSGSGGPQVGLAVRQDTTGTAAYAAGVSYVPLVNTGTLLATRPNSFGGFVRKTPALQEQYRSTLNPSDMKPPCWVRITRVGNDLAFSKSSNGSTWCPIYSFSGGAFISSGTAEIGMFAASGTVATSVTGTLDNVSLISNPTLPFESGWVGNTRGLDSTGYVSGNAKAMWVSPDGVCYVNGAGDETGQSAKIYSSGTVRKRFDVLAGGGWEGSIAGNYISSGSGNVFLTSYYNTLASGIYKVDLNGSNPSVIYVADPPLLDDSGVMMVSGMTYGPDASGSNAYLYVSNPSTGVISISGTTRNSHGTQPLYMTNKVYSGSINLSGSPDVDGVDAGNPANDVDTSDVSYAPAPVYQSQFQSTSMTFSFGSFSGTNYTVLLHFAEFETTGTQRLMTIKVGSATASTDFTSPALGEARILKVTNVAPTKGSIGVAVLNSSTNSVNAILNGVEIFSGSTAVVRYRCGGTAFTGEDDNGNSEAWEGSINEVDHFTPQGIDHPGPLAIDKRGNLWVVEEGGAFPTSTGKFDIPAGNAFIECYSGTSPYAPLGNLIPQLDNPTAICYDTVNDRLLVTENGVDQNVRIYTDLTNSTPTLSGNFGATKGVFSGSNPGLVYDANDHKDARFYGPTGVGVDQSGTGNLYVLSNSGPNVTDLKAFAPGGTDSSGAMTWSETASWKLQALEFCNVGDFDPTTSGSDLWTPSHHYTMNYSGTDYRLNPPGGEWTLKSYLWNPFALSDHGASLAPRVEPRAAAVSAVCRRIGAQPYMYTCGQGQLMYHVGSINYGMDLFRIQGEQLTRSAEITYGSGSMTFWNDTNGNGIERYADSSTDEPLNSFQLGGAAPDSFDVDNDGDVYFAMAGVGQQPYVLKIAPQSGTGVPTYSGIAPGNVQYIFSTGTSVGMVTYGTNHVTAGSTVYIGNSYFSSTSHGGHDWGVKSHVRYFEDSDTMYLEGEAYPLAGTGTGSKNFGGYLERWDHWNQVSGTRSRHFGSQLPDPASEPNFENGAPPYTQVDGFSYEAMDVANNYAFISDNWGAIQVVGPEGTMVTKLYAGPGVSGIAGWCDTIAGVRAHYNPDTGEYIIAQENAGFHIRENLYRWKQPNLQLLYEDFQSPTAIDPFVVTSATTGGSTTLVTGTDGNKAVEFRDASTPGADAASTFTWTLPATHPLVQRINQVLSGTAGTYAIFAYQFDIKRSGTSSAPVAGSNGVAYIEAIPNDGNPPPGGRGRDRFWTGLAVAGTLSQYTCSGTENQFLKISQTDFPQGNDSSNPWRGFRFTVTSSGTNSPLTGLSLGFKARVNTGATPEAFQVDNLEVDELQ